MQCERAVQGYTWGSTGSQGRVPAPGEGQEGHSRTWVSCHSRWQEQRVYMEPGVGAGGTRGDGTGRRAGPRHTSGAVCGLCPTEAFMPGRDEITLIAVDGSGCLCLGGEWRGQMR